VDWPTELAARAPIRLLGYPAIRNLGCPDEAGPNRGLASDESKLERSSMLESIRKGQRWLTLVLVTFVGGVFIFFMGVGGGFQQGGPTGNAIVELGDTRMAMVDFQRVRSQQEASYREQLGDQFDPRAAAPFLDSQALRTLVESAILVNSARDLGLMVSRQEIQRLVRQSPAFRNESGQFDKDAFVSYAEYEFGSQRLFLEIVRQDLLRQKMIGLLYGLASVSDSEAREAVLYGLEEVRIGFVDIEAERLPDGETLDESEVAVFFEANRDALRVRYDQDITEYQIPEQARARHILVQVGRDASEEEVAEAKARIEAARERIVGGESFEAVAKEISEDPGSRDRGGDLGLFARGTHSDAIDEAAFSLDPGSYSEAVRGDAGFHLVLIESREPSSTRSFDEVGLELARTDTEKQAAGARARALADELSAAIAGGESLETAARARDLTLERTTMIKRRPDGFVPGLGGAPEIQSTVFALDMESPSSGDVFEVGTRLVLIQLLERSMPDATTLDEAIASQSEILLSSKRNQMIQDWIDRRRETLETNGDLLINSSLVLTGT
jgi:peptidyl-prolyl cis-trans isomerase D